MGVPTPRTNEQLLKDMQERITLLERNQRKNGSASGGSGGAPVVIDTGWVDITINSGFAAQNPGSEQAQVRKIGNEVFLRGGFSTTGISATTTSYGVGQLPSSTFYPPKTTFIPGSADRPTRQPQFLISTAGAITLRTDSELGAYYFIDGQFSQDGPFTSGIYTVEDTGWISVPILSSFTQDTHPLQYRVRNEQVILRGGLVGTFPDGYTDVTTAGAIPAAVAPTVAVRAGGVTSGGYLGGVVIDTGGKITAVQRSGSNRAWWATNATWFVG